MAADPEFRTTRWSLIRTAAGDPGASGRAALEDLCRAYWYPLYAFARRRGVEHAAAEDAVQGLFADVLARGDLAQADPERGRFRTWLRTALKNHMANLDDHARALKRGAGEQVLSLDFTGADERYGLASGVALSAEALFDRAWALTLLDSALADLRADYARRDKSAVFDALRPAITAGEEPLNRPEICERMGWTAGALKVAVHRLRERYRESLRKRVADTLEDSADLERELADLFEALGG